VRAAAGALRRRDHIGTAGAVRASPAGCGAGHRTARVVPLVTDVEPDGSVKRLT